MQRKSLLPPAQPAAQPARAGPSGLPARAARPRRVLDLGLGDEVVGEGQLLPGEVEEEGLARKRGKRGWEGGQLGLACKRQKL